MTSYVAVATSTKVAPTRVIKATRPPDDTRARCIGEITVRPADRHRPDQRSTPGPATRQDAAGPGERLGGRAGQRDPEARRCGSSARASRRRPTEAMRLRCGSRRCPRHARLAGAAADQPQPRCSGSSLGLLLGFAYALVRHQFDRRLRSSEEVEKQFGVPVIGMIPQSSAHAAGRRPRAHAGGHRVRRRERTPAPPRASASCAPTSPTWTSTTRRGSSW